MSGLRGVRLRSGRHHHEGMCSGEKVLVLDVSPMNSITMSDLGATLTVGPGAKLRDIYTRMSQSKRILPGGGCGDVCIGGLVQGAGWGLYSREHGLTCDRLVQFTIIKADGCSATVRRPEQGERDLFWAVAGGGGGNFGVVTEFVFELAMRPDTVWSVEITWDDASLIEEVVSEWCERSPTATRS
jgi:FAD/FMN-containing dehydrogenase